LLSKAGLLNKTLNFSVKNCTKVLDNLLRAPNKLFKYIQRSIIRFSQNEISSDLRESIVEQSVRRCIQSWQTTFCCNQRCVSSAQSSKVSSRNFNFSFRQIEFKPCQFLYPFHHQKHTHHLYSNSLDDWPRHFTFAH
jgi:hypothetical protein